MNLEGWQSKKHSLSSQGSLEFVLCWLKLCLITATSILLLRFAESSEAKSMETFAWRLSKVYYLCPDAFHSLPPLSSSPSFSCHSAALIFIPLVCLSFTRRIHPTYQLQPSNRFLPRRLPHGNSFLMNFKRDVSALTWKTESGNGKREKSTSWVTSWEDMDADWGFECFSLC